VPTRGSGYVAATSRDTVPQLANMLRVGLSPQILLMVSKVYVPVLFPFTFAIAWMSLALDRALGWSKFLPEPANLFLAGCSLAGGLLVVGLAYTDLVIDGHGSPSPTAGRTQRLVIRGLYARCRNPSVHGKLLGVLSVGFALNSASFCVLVVPSLLAISLVEKIARQEPQLVAFFGEEYLEYRKNVPLFLPRIRPWHPRST
jgi:protein-S-isoprenylcysteine O-methyltransferase Ste14